MLVVKIPAEIRDYKGKLVAGLNIRQMIALGGALACSVPIGALLYKSWGQDVLWLCLIIALPFLLFGWAKIDGMTFEEYAKTLWYYFRTPQKRPYEDENTNVFVKIRNDINSEKIKEERIKKGVYNEAEELDEETEDEE
jgi:hypothetical protein